MQRNVIIPYEGSKPYAFVSYAHKDTKQVMPILLHLYSMGYRIWFDDGIAPGAEWPENIARHLKNSALVIAFVSPNSVVSDNCRREVTYALKLHIPFLGVFLEKTDLTDGMDMQLGAHQCVLKYNYREEGQFIQQICKCPEMEPCRDSLQPGHAPSKQGRTSRIGMGEHKKQKPPLWMGIAVVAALALGFFTVHFWTEGSCSEAPVCRICGKEGSLAGHTWQSATCTASKTCLLCGAEEGIALGHQWTAATCMAPKTCTVCGTAEGDAGDHLWTATTDTGTQICVLCGAEAEIPADDPLADLRPGDTFTFGTYEQDSNLENGCEAIVWQVLDKQDDQLLVISKYTLDQATYCTGKDAYVTWENCSLRKWLNHTFLNRAFSEEEQSRIMMTTVRTETHPDYDTDAGNPAEDYLFVLSMREAEQYFADYNERICEATDYARAKGVRVEIHPNRGCWWWLRTPGESQDKVICVYDNGAFDPDGCSVYESQCGVRPAMWITVGG